VTAAPDVPPDSAPDFSVVVPVYRQWRLVPALLEALAAQDIAAGRIEVILVNNGPPEAPCPALPPTLPLRVRRLACGRPGAYAARNLGAAAARGRWLVFTDADCRPEPGWLAALAAATAAGPPGLLSRPVRVTSVAGRPNACEIYEIVRGIPQTRYLRHGYAATANLAVPAAAFRALGGFDPARFSGGDAEFCRRARAAGWGLRLVPGAVVDHPARADWPGLVRKARRVKGGQVAAGRPARRLAWTLRSLVPPVREAAHFLAAGEHPLRHRLTAAAVRFRLWGVELAEVARLLAGRSPERG
jgi:cellulose synthase/poly-beta-1,6-N-acetylglucosamine synthase-like glycosyltransferase